MLSHLSVRNYALIRHLEVDFSDGFTVITGETGSGKSILLGALNLVLGKRADSSVLLNRSQKCHVEATFQIKDYGLKPLFIEYDIDYDDTTILRREINNTGKSRAFINDTPINLTVLYEFGKKMIDIHSQGEHYMLGDAGFQLSAIDSFFSLHELVTAFNGLYNEWSDKKSMLKDLLDEELKSRSQEDYLRYVVEELNIAQLKTGEQEEFEQELEVLKNAEEINKILFEATLTLEKDEHNILDRLSGIAGNLSKLSHIRKDFSDLANRFGSAVIDLKDICSEMQHIEERVIYDPGRASEITERLDMIYKLQKKHRVNSIESLLEVKSDLEIRISCIDSLEQQITELQKTLSDIEKQLQAEARQISEKRQKAFQPFTHEIEKVLIPLGMTDAKFKIHHEFLPEVSKNGIDRIVFLFNANRGGELQDLSKVASGGEKSRLMLAVKSLLSKTNLLPTIIFDEIDSGVSGAVAEKVGNILKKLSKHMQVIAITHLPQIAGLGVHHFKVYKKSTDDQTKTELIKLEQEERITEIAKLMSGEEITAPSLESAKYLLKK